MTLRWSGGSRIPIGWICTGWIPSGRWARQGVFQKPSRWVYQTTICKRCTEEDKRLFMAWITTGSIKIFSITICTQYCLLTCKITQDAFRIVLYVLQLFTCSIDLSTLLLRCTMLYATVFVLWINKFKCSLKTSVSLVLVTENLKL